MTYLVTFCFLRVGGQQVLLDGPDGFDVSAEFQDWRRQVMDKVGPEPNIACYGSHGEWLIRQMSVLREYQLKYDYEGDFLGLFVEHLVQRCGFQRRPHREIRLA